jgi:hypothetical protein
MTYAVFCYSFDKPSVKIKSNLSLQDAQAICHNPDTNSSTTKDLKLLKKYGKGPWFYGYTEE